MIPSFSFCIERPVSSAPFPFVSSEVEIRLAQRSRVSTSLDTNGGRRVQKNRRPGQAETRPGRQRGETYFSSAPFSGVMLVPFAAAVAAIAAGDTISPLAFR